MNQDNKNNEFNLGLSEFVDSIGRFLGDAKQSISDKFDSLKELRENFQGTIPYSYKVENGVIVIEIIVTGHTPECISVRYNKKANVLKVEDKCDIPEEKRPWYLNILNLEFVLPKTTINDSFVKNIQNGVLTITAKYVDDPEKELSENVEFEV